MQHSLPRDDLNARNLARDGSRHRGTRRAGIHQVGAIGHVRTGLRDPLLADVLIIGDGKARRSLPKDHRRNQTADGNHRNGAKTKISHHDPHSIDIRELMRLLRTDPLKPAPALPQKAANH